MGMALALTMLGDRNIDRLLADPPLVWKVIAPDDPEAYERARLRCRTAVVLQPARRQERASAARA